MTTVTNSIVNMAALTVKRLRKRRQPTGCTTVKIEFLHRPPKPSGRREDSLMPIRSIGLLAAALALVVSSCIVATPIQAGGRKHDFRRSHTHENSRFGRRTLPEREAPRRRHLDRPSRDRGSNRNFCRQNPNACHQNRGRSQLGTYCTRHPSRCRPQKGGEGYCRHHPAAEGCRRSVIGVRSQLGTYCARHPSRCRPHKGTEGYCRDHPAAKGCRRLETVGKPVQPPSSGADTRYP
jgi:hypothetical protein